MKQRFILLTALLLLGLGAQAQRRSSDQVIQAYPAVGFTVSQMEGDELKGFDKWGFTAGVGAMVNLGRSEMFKLSLEASFAQRGAYNGTGDPYSMDLTLNYVDIPLMFHFHDPYGGMMFGVGLTYGRLVQQPHSEIFYAPNYFIPDSSDMRFLKNDLAFTADMRFTLWRGLKLDFRYQCSLIPIKKEWRFTEIGVNEQFEYINDCFSSSISARLMYVFGDDGSKPKPNLYRRNSRHKSHYRR